MELEVVVAVTLIVTVLSAGLGYLLKSREARTVAESSATVMERPEVGVDTRREQAALLHAIVTSGVTSIDELAISLKLTPSEVRRQVEQLAALNVVELEEKGQVRLKERQLKRKGE